MVVSFSPVLWICAGNAVSWPNFRCWREKLDFLRSRRGLSFKGFNTTDYAIEKSKCTCVAVQKKGQNRGHLLNSKSHKNEEPLSNWNSCKGMCCLSLFVSLMKCNMLKAFYQLQDHLKSMCCLSFYMRLWDNRCKRNG